MAEPKTTPPTNETEGTAQAAPEGPSTEAAPETPADAPQPDAPPADAPQADAGAAPAADETPEQAIARLEAEAADLKDQLLRALAETENVRRRARRDREDTARYAAAPLLRDLIEVADNLRRAIEAVPAEAVAQDSHLKTLITGVEMTEKSMQAVFEKHHITRIEPLGQRLDPHLHEAIFEIPDPSQPAGTVLQVVRAGYRLHDRLLRPAQVGVAKGGPAPGNGNAPAPGGQVDTSA